MTKGSFLWPGPAPQSQVETAWVLNDAHDPGEWSLPKAAQFAAAEHGFLIALVDTVLPDRRRLMKALRVHAQTGKCATDYTFGEGFSSVFGPIVDEDRHRVIIALDSRLWSLDVSTLKVHWESRLGWMGSSRAEALTLARNVIAVCRSGKIHVVHAETGRELWTQEVHLIGTTMAGSDASLVICDRDSVNCLDPQTGAKRWGLRVPKEVRSVAIDGGEIALTCDDRFLYRVDEESGDPISEVELSSKSMEPIALGHGLAVVPATVGALLVDSTGNVRVVSGTKATSPPCITPECIAIASGRTVVLADRAGRVAQRSDLSRLTVRTAHGISLVGVCDGMVVAAVGHCVVGLGVGGQYVRGEQQRASRLSRT